MPTPSDLNDEELRLLQAMEALGKPVQGSDHDLLDRLDRKVAAVYRVNSALKDLEEKGLVESEPTVHVDREGRPKRAYRLTPAGVAAFQGAPPAPPPRARRSAPLVVGSPGPEELAPRPVAPSWWRRALRKVIPGAALREELYQSVSEVDPAVVHAVHAAAAGKPTFNEALTAALHTAFLVTDPGTAALPAGGTIPSEYAKVPLRDLVALQETLAKNECDLRDLERRLGEKNEQVGVLCVEIDKVRAERDAADNGIEQRDEIIDELRASLAESCREQLVINEENYGLAAESAKLIASLGEYIRQSMTANPEWRNGILEIEAILMQRRQRVDCPNCGHKKHGENECGASDGTAEPGRCLCLGRAS